jgi:deoxyribodipyrimidine photo-lyase
MNFIRDFLYCLYMKLKQQALTIFWFRRDLRLQDNAGLYQALKNETHVLPIFIFDKNILDRLPKRKDRRVALIHHALTEIQKQLLALGSTLQVEIGSPLEVFQKLAKDHTIKSVYTNHDYEPYAIQRDESVGQFLATQNISFHTFKDQCIFEKSEVTKDDGKPYTVFTPYSKKWKAKLQAEHLQAYPSENYFTAFIKWPEQKLPSLSDIGFETLPAHDFLLPINATVIPNYKALRDFPAKDGTTKVSAYLRFGLVSIREKARLGLNLSESWLNELIWRDFYMMILWHFPHVQTQAFKPIYDQVEWRNNEVEFKAWCEGKTGYPIVDAGMRELNTTGFMHNRVRMVTASFLVKHLLVDWRWGEAYFANHLNDFELSSNNGGWQWAASSGCDAAPYFRIFNPAEQQRKFDPQCIYIKKWVPEFGTVHYPQPIVEHKMARERVLRVYKMALGYGKEQLKMEL